MPTSSRPDQGVPQRRAMLVVGSIVALLAALAVPVTLLLESRQGQGESGNGFTLRGEFYLMSGAEVREERLGAVLDRAVPIRDTTADVRAITGVDPGVAVAALVHDMAGTPAADGSAWLLMSPDEDLAADPWSDDDLAGAVNDQ